MQIVKKGGAVVTLIDSKGITRWILRVTYDKAEEIALLEKSSIEKVLSEAFGWK